MDTGGDAQHVFWIRGDVPSGRVSIFHCGIHADFVMQINEEISNMSMKIDKIHRNIEDKDSEKGKPIETTAKEVGPLLPKRFIMGSCHSLTDILCLFVNFAMTRKASC